MKAMLFEQKADHKVQCHLCNHRCVIMPGKRGICGVRENQDGVLHSLVYGKLVATHVDPIEKKPLFHMAPGSLSYSIATVGCNFKCRFCQNADIAQMPLDRKGMIVGQQHTPEEIVEAAISQGCKSIAYTYTEPTVYFEIAYDTAKLANARGIYNVFVSNGYMTREAIELIAPYLDGANVDLKAFSDKFYKNMCQAKLEHVKNSLKLLKSNGILVEVTTLLIPGENDDPVELEQMAGFLANELGVDTPWHISRFHPTYRLTDRPPTPVSSLNRAREIGLAAGLRYVYTGNAPGESGENTYCYECGQLLLQRWGFSIRKNEIQDGQCRYCHAKIDGIDM